MRLLTYLAAVTILYLPTTIAAQSDALQYEQAQATNQSADNDQDNPAVLLTPIQSGAPTDAALINDMCKLQERQVQVYRLQNALVVDVADSVNNWLKGKLKSNKASVNGFICNAPVIIVPDNVTNSLVVSVVAEFKHAGELDRMIRELDSGTNMLEVSAVIKRTVAGETTTLGSPRLMVREGTPASFSFGTPGDEITIELTARLVEPSNSAFSKPRTADRSTDEFDAIQK